MADERLQLTPEQLKHLAEYRAEWLKCIVCTDPSDRPTTEEVLIEMYKELSLKEPQFVWFDGPMSAATVRAMASTDQGREFIGELRETVTAVLLDDFFNCQLENLAATRAVGVHCVAKSHLSGVQPVAVISGGSYIGIPVAKSRLRLADITAVAVNEIDLAIAGKSLVLNTEFETMLGASDRRLATAGYSLQARTTLINTMIPAMTRIALARPELDAADEPASKVTRDKRAKKSQVTATKIPRCAASAVEAIRASAMRFMARTLLDRVEPASEEQLDPFKEVSVRLPVSEFLRAGYIRKIPGLVWSTVTGCMTMDAYSLAERIMTPLLNERRQRQYGPDRPAAVMHDPTAGMSSAELAQYGLDLVQAADIAQAVLEKVMAYAPESAEARVSDGLSYMQQFAQRAADVIADTRNSSILSWSFWGQHESYWVAYYDWPDRYLKKIHTPKIRKKLDHWMALSRSTNWWHPTDHYVFACERPMRCELDDAMRPHSEDGPAYETRDGWKLWYINGVEVDQQVVESPETQTIDQINNEGNEEAKRIRIERYGWPKYLQDSGASQVELRLNAVENTKELLVTTKQNITVLVCSCPTGRLFSLEVPPGTKSCEEAQAYLRSGSTLASRVKFNPIGRT